MSPTTTTQIDVGLASGPTRRSTNFVAGVIDDRDQLESALRELVEVGFDPASIGVRYGRTGIEAFETRPRNWIGEMLSDESEYVGRFAEELRLGRHAIRVSVPAPVDGNRALVARILRRHGVHHVISMSRWMFEADPG